MSPYIYSFYSQNITYKDKDTGQAMAPLNFEVVVETKMKILSY